MAIKYLAGDRLQGTAAERAALSSDASPTWEGDFDMSNPYSNGWTAEASNKIGLDAANNDISFNFDASGTEENLVYDLQHADALDGSNAHATNWVLRFKVTIDTYVRTDGAGNGAFFGIGSADSTVAAAAAQDFLGFVIWNSTGSHDQIVKTCWGNNENIATNAATIDSSTASGDIYYVEIKRTADETYSVRLTTSSDYTGTSGGGYGEVTNVDASGVTNLRYFSMKNYSGGTGNPNDIIGRLEDLKFYNGITSIAGAVQPDLVNGAIFEESDTGKHYMFDGTDTWNEVT